MDTKFQIKEVNSGSLEDWLILTLKLWPDNDIDSLRDELMSLLSSSYHKSFVAMNTSEAKVVGFINLSIRNDYVEGSDKSPTGYLEGIYVEETHRSSGIGIELLHAGEQWLISKGCSQMGSDTSVLNAISKAFHTKAGFSEVATLIHYIKDIH